MVLSETKVSKRGSRGGKPRSVYVHMGVWYEPETGFIHLAAPKEDSIHAVISNKPGTSRYQPKFFAQLKELLQKYDRWPGAVSKA